MSFTKTLLALLSLSVYLVFSSGCGSRTEDDSAVAKQRHELTEIHNMYTIYMKKNDRPPQAKDLLEKEDPIHSAGYRAMKSNDYVIVWGVDVKKTPGAVLAYEKDAPQQGGTVLLADGSIRKMSAEELKAAVPVSK